MKKLVLMFVAIAAISFAACDEKKQAPATEGADSTQVELTDSTAAPADTTAQDSAAVK
ncbi:MAG: entericidin [Prevotella sp.]|nr:entericidin [Prevotella sp.]